MIKKISVKVFVFYTLTVHSTNHNFVNDTTDGNHPNLALDGVNVDGSDLNYFFPTDILTFESEKANKKAENLTVTYECTNTDDLMLMPLSMNIYKGNAAEESYGSIDNILKRKNVCNNANSLKKTNGSLTDNVCCPDSCQECEECWSTYSIEDKVCSAQNTANQNAEETDQIYTEKMTDTMLESDDFLMHNTDDCLSIYIVENLLRAILYYRYNLRYFFDIYFLKMRDNKNRYINNITSVFLRRITKISLQFASMSHDNLTIKNRVGVYGTAFEQLEADESKIVAETTLKHNERNWDALKDEIARIRNYNKTVYIQINKKTKNTPFSSFKKEIKELLGRCYATNRYLDMFLQFLKPLYKLSVLFDRPQNSLLHTKIARVMHFHQSNCVYDTTITCHHLFHWVFYWIFNFSNYDLASCFYEINISVNYKIIPHNFFIYLVIIVYSFLVYENDSFSLDFNNEVFLEKWETNISDLLLESIEDTNKIFLNHTVFTLLTEIKDTHDVILKNSNFPEYLRITRTGQEHVNRSSALTNIVKCYIHKILSIANRAYAKTKTEMEVGITNQDILHTVETEKLRKYDLLANELSLVHKCKVNIIPFVLTWDGIVTTYHEKYRKDLKVSNRIEAYIQSKVLHKTLESVSLDYRRKCEDGISEREVMTVVNKDLLATTIESI